MTLKSILVVDDEPTNFDVIESMLGSAQFRLFYASGGASALSLLDTVHPELVLLDVMMPDMDGLEVCRRIKARPEWQAIPIIMVTALSGKSDLADCLAAGADDFISKPVTGLELRARIHSMLRLKQQHDHIAQLSRLKDQTILLLRKSMDELRSNLVSSFPHELNTPLNGISGVIALLRSDLPDMDPQVVQQLLECADISARRLESLTKRFLQYLELELGGRDGVKAKGAGSEFSSAVLERQFLGLPEGAGRHGDLRMDMQEARVRLRPDFLELVLSELLDNALKFSSPGNLVRVISRMEGNRLWIEVQDRGRGMTAAQIAKVDAFMQFERKRYEQQGIGLGLKIVQKTTELADGHFSLESVYGEGTTARLSLPLAAGPVG